MSPLLASRIQTRASQAPLPANASRFPQPFNRLQPARFNMQSSLKDASAKANPKTPDALGRISKIWQLGSAPSIPPLRVQATICANSSGAAGGASPPASACARWRSHAICFPRGRGKRRPRRARSPTAKKDALLGVWRLAGRCFGQRLQRAAPDLPAEDATAQLARPILLGASHEHLALRAARPV